MEALQWLIVFVAAWAVIGLFKLVGKLMNRDWRSERQKEADRKHAADFREAMRKDAWPSDDWG